jgi:IS5 family transposase
MSKNRKEPKSALKHDLFAHEAHERKIDSLADPLQRINEHIQFSELAAELDQTAPRACSIKGGRPAFPTEIMVRILVLKRLYNLSDEQMEYQLLDRMSYQRFCGLKDISNIPDRTTIWTFENRIGVAGAQALFEAVNTQLLRQGFIARGGQIVDATLVPVPRQHLTKENKEILEHKATPIDWNASKRRQKDTDASWTKKHDKSYFGYKLSVNIDAQNKFIRQIKTDTAKVHDSQHFKEIVSTNNTNGNVFADRGYPSQEHSRWLKSQGLSNRIQSKGAKNKPLSQRAKARNKTIAKTRARVEHVFGSIHQMGGKMLRTIGQARADFGMTMMATCYNLKRLSMFNTRGIVAF